MEAIALYDFSAEDPEEISFEANERIVVLATDDDTQDGWWKGKNANGDIGFFPFNYVSTDPALLNNAGHAEDDQVIVEDDDEATAPAAADSTEPKTAKINTQLAMQEAVWASQEEDEWRQLKAAKDVVAASKTAPAAASALLTSSQPLAEILAITAPPPISVTLPLAAELQAKAAAAHAAPVPPMIDDSIETMPLAPPQESRRMSRPPKALAPTTDPEQWSKNDVAQWLIAAGFEEFRDTFHTNEITGEALLELDQETLKEMKIRSIGRRIKLLLAITRLKERDEEPSTPSTPLATIVDDDEDVPHQAPPMGPPTQALPAPPPSSTAAVPGAVTAPASDVIGQVPLSPSAKAATLQPGFGSIRVDRKEIHQSQMKSKRTRTRPLTMVVPNITAAEVEKPEHQGWLWKQGGNVKTWKRRWFILKSLCLYYFKAPEDAKALGFVPLPSFSVTAAKEIKKPYAFKAFHPGARTYYFYADSESEMNLWLKHMQRAAVPVGEQGEQTFTAPTVPVPMVPSAVEKKPITASLALATPQDLLAMSIAATANLNFQPPSPTSGAPPLASMAPPAQSAAPAATEPLTTLTSSSSTLRKQAPKPPSDQHQRTLSGSNAAETGMSSAVPPNSVVATAASAVAASAVSAQPPPAATASPMKPAATAAPSAAPSPAKATKPDPVAAKPAVAPKAAAPAPATAAAAHTTPGALAAGAPPAKTEEAAAPAAAPAASAGPLNISAGLQALKKTNKGDTDNADEERLLIWLNAQRTAGLMTCESEMTKANLSQTLEDGVALITLLEGLSKEALGKYTKTPRMRVQKLENLSSALKFMDKLGAPVSGVTSEDIASGDRRKTLAVLRAIEKKFGAA